MTDGTRFVLPDVTDPVERLCAAVPVPNDQKHINAFLSALRSLAWWFNWQQDGTNAAKQAADVWRDIINGVVLVVDCSGDGGGTMFFRRKPGETLMVLQQSPTGIDESWTDTGYGLPGIFRMFGGYVYDDADNYIGDVDVMNDIGHDGDGITYDTTVIHINRSAFKGDKGDNGQDGQPGRDGTDGQPGQDGQPGRDGTDGQPGQDGKDAALLDNMLPAQGESKEYTVIVPITEFALPFTLPVGYAFEYVSSKGRWFYVDTDTVFVGAQGDSAWSGVFTPGNRLELMAMVQANNSNGTHSQEIQQVIGQGSIEGDVPLDIYLFPNPATADPAAGNNFGGWIEVTYRITNNQAALHLNATGASIQVLGDRRCMVTATAVPEEGYLVTMASSRGSGGSAGNDSSSVKCHWNVVSQDVMYNTDGYSDHTVTVWSDNASSADGTGPFTGGDVSGFSCHVKGDFSMEVILTEL